MCSEAATGSCTDVRLGKRCPAVAVIPGSISAGNANLFNRILRNPGRDISFPIFTRKEVETKRIGKEIKTIMSRLNDLSSFLSNIEQNRN